MSLVETVPVDSINDIFEFREVWYDKVRGVGHVHNIHSIMDTPGSEVQHLDIKWTLSRKLANTIFPGFSQLNQSTTSEISMNYIHE